MFEEGVRRIVNNHQNFASSRLRVNQKEMKKEDIWKGMILTRRREAAKRKSRRAI